MPKEQRNQTMARPLHLRFRKVNKMKTTNPFVSWLDTIKLEDLANVGGKNANLGELLELAKTEKIRIPNGFAVTSEAFKYFLRKNNLSKKIDELLESKKSSLEIRKIICESPMPEDLILSITNAYEELVTRRSGRMDVAIRSSATSEDLPTASFAGLQDTYLNVNGIHDVITSIRKCFSSLYNERAISYREERKIKHEEVSISVTVQEMVRSDLSVSGVMFTIDTETGFENHILIESSYGLGNTIVQGEVNPDSFVVFKPKLELNYVPIIQKKIGTKEIKSVYDLECGECGAIKTVNVSPVDQKRFSLNDQEILELAQWGKKIEAHYQKKTNHKSPMDIEWGKDGLTGQFYILQARPETVHSQKIYKNEVWQNYTLDLKSKVIITGNSVGNSIHAGTARVIESSNDLSLLKWGEILITDKTDPDWEPAMKKASAIVTNRGGRTCHAAIVARELGIPAIVGTNSATKSIFTGQKITVSSAEGSIGYVYEGELPIRISALPEINIDSIKTSIMMNLGTPEQATKLSFLPNNGIGLARIEFIISSGIGVHPMAIAHLNDVKSEETRAKIKELSSAYEDPEDFFINTLSYNTAMIVSAFYPKPVVVRFSDFKSNEYSKLIGGSEFEAAEENPMLGFRGAIRYAHKDYQDGFKLECKAMIKVKETMGLSNLKLMIPFCRTINEAKLVLAELEKNGISKKGGYEIMMMCEIPSNVILAKEFLELFDGYSIGSNDLTQLILGIDRDSEKVSSSFDERNMAVTRMIASVIKIAREMKKPIGICGQGPSDHPDFAEFLVREGINSISLNPDSILKTIPYIRDAERKENKLSDINALNLNP